MSRTAVVGLDCRLPPRAHRQRWTDTAGYVRPTGLAQFLGVEFRLEVRTELNRR